MRSHPHLSHSEQTENKKGSLTHVSLSFRVQYYDWFMISKPENFGSRQKHERVKTLLSQEKREGLGSRVPFSGSETLLWKLSRVCGITWAFADKKGYFIQIIPPHCREKGLIVIIKGMLTGLRRDYILLSSSELKICFGDLSWVSSSLLHSNSKMRWFVFVGHLRQTWNQTVCKHTLQIQWLSFEF